MTTAGADPESKNSSLKDKAKAAAKAAALTAEKAKIKTVSLPIAYTALGQDCYKTKRWEKDFPEIYSGIRRLREQYAELKKQMNKEIHASESIMNKVAGLAKKSAGAAKAQELKLAAKIEFAKLGRAVFDKYGAESGPNDLVNVIEAYRAKVAELEIAFGRSPAVGVSKRWLVLAGGTAAVVVLFLILIPWMLATEPPRSEIAPESSQKAVFLSRDSAVQLKQDKVSAELVEAEGTRQTQLREPIAVAAPQVMDLSRELAGVPRKLNDFRMLGRREASRGLSERRKSAGESDRLEEERKQEATRQQREKQKESEQREAAEGERKKQAIEKERKLVGSQLAELERIFSTINIQPTIHLSRYLQTRYSVTVAIKGQSHAEFSAMQEQKNWVGLYNLFGRKSIRTDIPLQSLSSRDLPSLQELDYIERSLPSDLEFWVEIKADVPVVGVEDFHGWESRRLTVSTVGPFTFTVDTSDVIASDGLLRRASYALIRDGTGRVSWNGPGGSEDRILYKVRPRYSGIDIVISYLSDSEWQSSIPESEKSAEGLRLGEELMQKIRLGEVSRNQAIEEARTWYGRVTSELVNALVKYSPPN